MPSAALLAGAWNGVAVAADISCRSLSGAGSLRLEAQGVETGGAAWQIPLPSRELPAAQAVSDSCGRIVSQFQGLGWSNAKSCRGLLDARKPEASGQAYFDGPNDPSRCLATALARGFRARLRGALDAWGIHADGNGRGFTPREMRAVFRALDRRGGCAAGAVSLAGQYQCYLRSFVDLAASLKTARARLATGLDGAPPAGSARPTPRELCEAMTSSGARDGELALVLDLAGNTPGGSRCAEALPQLAKACGKSATAPDSPLTSGQWRCVTEGIYHLAEDNHLDRLAGAINPIRLALAQLRADAIDVSVFARLCAANFQVRALADGDFRLESGELRAQRETLCLPALLAGLRGDPGAVLARDPALMATGGSGPGAATGPNAPVAAAPTAPAQARPQTPPATCNGLAQDPTQGSHAHLEKIARHCLDVAARASSKSRLPATTPVTGSATATESATASGADSEPAMAAAPAADAASDLELDATILALLDDIKPSSSPLASANPSPTPAPVATTIVPPPAPLPPKLASAREQMRIALPPLKGVSPEAVAARMRTSEALVAAAQAELEAFKQKSKAQFDFGRFFLETEGNTQPPWGQERFSTLLSRYLRKKDAYAGMARGLQGTFASRVRQLMARINEDFLKDYTASNALLSDFLDGHGGNCEGETKFLATVLRDTGFAPEDGWVVGVQGFNDHVQPVLFHRASRHVIVLHTMEEYDGLIAPIYDPDILVRGYLGKQGASSPVSENELLIEGLNADEKRWAAARGGAGKSFSGTNTNLVLPQTGVMYGDGAVPERARISLVAEGTAVRKARDFKPVRHLFEPMRIKLGKDPNNTCGDGSCGGDGNSGSGASGHGGGGQKGNDGKNGYPSAARKARFLPSGLVIDEQDWPMTLSLEDISDPRAGISAAALSALNDAADELRAFSNLRLVSLDHFDVESTLVFRNRRDETVYLAALKAGDPSKGLEDIFEDELANILMSKPFEDAKTLFADPLRVAAEGWTHERIREATFTIANIRRFLEGRNGYKGTRYGTIGAFSGNPGVGGIQMPTRWQTGWLNRHREIEQLVDLRNRRAIYTRSHRREELALYDGQELDSILAQALRFGTAWDSYDLKQFVERIRGSPVEDTAVSPTLEDADTLATMAVPEEIGFRAPYQRAKSETPTTMRRAEAERRMRLAREAADAAGAREDIERIGALKAQANEERETAARDSSARAGLGSLERSIRIEPGPEQDSPAQPSDTRRAPGGKFPGPDVSDRQAGRPDARGAGPATRHGAGREATGLAQAPEPEARVKLLPAVFADRLHAALEFYCGTTAAACQPIGPKLLKRWTPAFSMALLRERKTSATSVPALWFTGSGYRRILSTRDPSSLTLPGPTGEKIPRDLALLWLAWGSDAYPQLSTAWAIHGLAPGDPYNSVDKFRDQLISKYHSLDEYKETLRKALRQELRPGAKQLDRE